VRATVERRRQQPRSSARLGTRLLGSQQAPPVVPQHMTVVEQQPPPVIEQPAHNVFEEMSQGKFAYFSMFVYFPSS
jgi:hypothetical protein